MTKVILDDKHTRDAWYSKCCELERLGEQEKRRDFNSYIHKINMKRIEIREYFKKYDLLTSFQAILYKDILTKKELSSLDATPLDIEKYGEEIMQYKILNEITAFLNENCYKEPMTNEEGAESLNKRIIPILGYGYVIKRFC